MHLNKENNKVVIFNFTTLYSDGPRSIKALRDHFAGEGNATRTMAEAERLHESRH